MTLIRDTPARCCLLALAAISLGRAADNPTLTIQGDVPATVVLKAEDLAQMKHVTVSVNEEKSGKMEYQGVPLSAVLERAGLPSGQQVKGKELATYVLATAHDGYQVVFSLAELAPQFANETILVTDRRAGKPMVEPVGPFRMICAGDQAQGRGVRMLEKLEVVRLRK
ncbi:MAG: molybdopterin-dependent oxidoreductase [Bryobacteraceae bacterium]|jgi:hypothetical protein